MTYKSEHKRGWTGKLRLYLHDEAPNIGCGWRWVEVTVGTNRVRLRCPHTRRTARVIRPIFDGVVKASAVIASK